MKPPKFHVGQAVVCITGTWYQTFGDSAGPRRPVKDRVYTVAHVQQWPRLKLYAISLDGFRVEDGFAEQFFAPAELASDEALAELLEEVFTLVTA